jgi:HPt (histidine-containing phosphotransfer) domain-containing protein
MTSIEDSRQTPPASTVRDTETVVFEFERLHDVCMHETDLERQFLGDLLALVPKVIARLTASVAAGDAADVHASAHALKGHCLMLGANALGRVCGELEHDARDGHLDRGRELLARAELELIRVRAVLDAYFDASIGATNYA